VDGGDEQLLRRGFILEWFTLGWNVVGVVVLAVAALRARSVALVGFGLDSLVEIGAGRVVLWELSGTDEHRQRRALRLIAVVFVAIDGLLAIAVLLGLTLNALASAWWADPLAGFVIVLYGLREANAILRDE
jgi:divalent metal cation (Fe/Co/Zn/Cd) transporter